MAKKKTAKKTKANKKAPAKAVSISKDINDEIIAAAISAAIPPILLKVCRLCETKDGPFLNIFNPDMITAKKIEAVMPFVITENDDLPHKICFRCSAKVEELYEFIQKCTQAQHNLRKAVGRKGSLVTKPKHRDLWEEKLNQSNISNDDICDALIKKAMEGIKDIPFSSELFKEGPSLEKKTVNKVINKEEPINELKAMEQATKEEQIEDLKLTPEKETKEVQAKNAEPEVPKVDDVPVTRPKRTVAKSNNSKKDTINEDKSIVIDPPLAEKEEKTKEPAAPTTDVSKSDDKSTELTNSFSLEDIQPPAEKPSEKPFNIMDHISPIKVNGFGILFQCNLCNRNFLNKEIVISHACAKNGISKVQRKEIMPPEPPKLPSVKYINTKTNSETKVVNEKPITLHEDDDDDDDDDKPLSTKKSKPKIGPASKVKRDSVAETAKQDSVAETANSNHETVTPAVAPNVDSPVLQLPSLPSLNSRYKLMPGPNNTFTLVEEKIPEPAINTSIPEKINPEQVEVIKPTRPIVGPKSFLNKEKLAAKNNKSKSATSNTLLAPSISQPIQNVKQPAPNIIKPASATQPYPVGLFKSLPSTNMSTSNLPDPSSTDIPTPVVKKQSYTIVQTGNPSKLLISTKSLPVKEPPKKRQKKPKHVEKEDQKQPYSVTLEDATPTRNAELFTFINVDPLLQPSYVLPTANIIQESQISTSTNLKNNENNKEVHASKYTCNMCNETFSREKKLLAHIQLHYKKMDEEDQIRAKNPRKRKS